jgi:hypothetical protein
VADILEIPQRVIARPVEAVSEVAHGHTGTTVDTATGGVDTVLREVAGPLRLTGGPEPVPQRILATVADAVATTATRTAPATATDTAVTKANDTVAAEVTDTVAAEVTDSVATADAGPGAGGGAAVSHRIAHRHRTARAVTERATATEEPPGGDRPAAPMQPHLGDVSGTPTSGSGTRTEGASAAFLPAAIANSTMACHLLPIVSDVQVRRHDAEAPTVSPD